MSHFDNYLLILTRHFTTRYIVCEGESTHPTCGQIEDNKKGRNFRSLKSQFIQTTNVGEAP